MDKTLSIPAVARDQIVTLLSSLLLPPAQGANVKAAIDFLAGLKDAAPVDGKPEEKKK